MTPRSISPARRRADELSDDAWAVTGPLKGYHHETYVLALSGEGRVVKIREPRAAILWFDRRCFLSEEELLRALQGRVTGIPDILDFEGLRLQGFIEGRVLPTYRWTGRRVPDTVFGQITDLFREMARITPSELAGVGRRCAPGGQAEEGDSDGFLERLIHFAEQQVYVANHPWFGNLFDELGVREESFAHLRKSVLGLRRRPFCLLHGDLHRGNLVVDGQGRLWTIDWELAMMGDPLYDLATHLYLMRYPADQERRMTEEWCRAVEGALPGGSYGAEEDLPLLLGFKRAQSVFTDVIRVSLSLRDGPGFNWVALPQAARKLQRILAAGAGPLGLARTPGHSEIMAALVRRQRTWDLRCA
ncbi:aminoglycoside phosphotransferase family protein [Streptomyces sp. SID5643]|uniref:aminoglycoside phosphotransferase family protein n=1 Tax=Streptomyces sp. SID5643 TaxID=2690307 RepID=UPI00136993A3|nr:aminoglycoside phosphotransferase family protein [Streptomyces sp. SID5643]MZF90020.1 phosphotransferase [Streptomyces sp. SID5643]